MDIQLMNCAESAAYYVCVYWCKSEPDDPKQALSKLFADMSKLPVPPSQYRKLLLIGNCVLKNRRLSAQEAGSVVCIWSIQVKQFDISIQGLFPSVIRFWSPNQNVMLYPLTVCISSILMLSTTIMLAQKSWNILHFTNLGSGTLHVTYLYSQKKKNLYGPNSKILFR